MRTFCKNACIAFLSSNDEGDEMQNAQAAKLGKKSKLDIREDGQFRPHSRGPAAHGHTNDYAELKQIIRQARHLEIRIR